MVHPRPQLLSDRQLNLVLREVSSALPGDPKAANPGVASLIVALNERTEAALLTGSQSIESLLFCAKETAVFLTGSTCLQSQHAHKQSAAQMQPRLLSMKYLISKRDEVVILAGHMNATLGRSSSNDALL